MSQDLNASLALAKQYFEELVRLSPLDALCRHQYATDAAKARVEFLLRKLNSLIGTIERALMATASNVGEAPIITLSSGHLTFYRESLEPNAELIGDAFLDSEGFEGLAELLKSIDSEQRGAPIGNAIVCGLERWIDMLDDGENADWLRRGFDLDAAFDMASKPWFLPDTWLENARLLQPILVDRPAQKIPTHVRHRLSEIYGAFIFGLWMAAIALSRSAVEFSIRDNAHRLNIELTKTNKRGEVEDKRLGELIADVAGIRPGLLIPMEAIRDTGNRILHPKKRDVIAFPKVLREEALNCVKHTKVVLEALYTDAEYERNVG